MSFGADVKFYYLPTLLKYTITFPLIKGTSKTLTFSSIIANKLIKGENSQELLIAFAMPFESRVFNKVVAGLL
jgi:hypothetical protein